MKEKTPKYSEIQIEENFKVLDEKYKRGAKRPTFRNSYGLFLEWSEKEIAEKYKNFIKDHPDWDKSKFVERTIQLELIPFEHWIGEKNKGKDSSYKRFRELNMWAVWGANAAMTARVGLADSFLLDKKEKKSILIKKYPNKTGEGYLSYSALLERKIKETSPCLPSCISNILAQEVDRHYKNDKKEKRSVRTYRENSALPVDSRRIAFEGEESDLVVWSVGTDKESKNKEILKYKIKYGKDKIGNRKTVKEIISGEINKSSTFRFKVKNNKLFLLVPIKKKKKDLGLDKNKCAGADLGMTVLAFVATNDGKISKPIGDGREFLRIRTKIQKQRKRIQKSTSFASGGRGRNKKNKAYYKLKKREDNFVKTYNEKISSRVVGFAINNGCGTIKLEFLEGFGFDENGENNNKFILRNWSYYSLQKRIKDKAEENGIEVIFVDPYHTSQECSFCGFVHEGNRLNQSDFKCLNCKKEINADENAAINIARSNKFVTKKEECEYYIKKQQEKEEKKKLRDSSLKTEENSTDLQKREVAVCTNAEW